MLQPFDSKSFALGRIIMFHHWFLVITEVSITDVGNVKIDYSNSSISVEHAQRTIDLKLSYLDPEFKLTPNFIVIEYPPYDNFDVNGITYQAQSVYLPPLFCTGSLVEISLLQLEDRTENDRCVISNRAS